MTIKQKNGSWSSPTSADEVENARAEAIADALGELIGKRLDRPTAHSIGKLFQKRLVGRPAWIGDGQMVATLRKFEGHSQNTYRVEVSTPGQSSVSANTFAPADPGQNIPHNPHIPRDGGAGAGNVGKEGNDSATAAPAGSVISSDAGRTVPRWSKRL